jgi:glycosyltransferase involved in cell wall biosynthesis
MNNLISFGIPTYNRAKMLDEALDYFYNTLKLCDFQLLISDNCSTDNSVQVIKRYASKYDNIQFFIQDRNIGADKNMVFLQDKCNTQYFMLLGDGVRLFKDQIYILIELLSKNNYDAILFNYNSRIKHIKSKIYTDRNAILNDLGWAITQMSSYIISNKVIEKKIPETFLYEGCEFNYYSRLFYFLSEKDCCNVYWYSENCLTFSHIPKLNSWHKRFMDVWIREYVETILSLPINYKLEAKLNCLKSFSHYPVFQLGNIISLIFYDCITSKQIIDYKKYVPFILNWNWRVYYILCFFPKYILRILCFSYSVIKKITKLIYGVH